MLARRTAAAAAEAGGGAELGGDGCSNAVAKPLRYQLCERFIVGRASAWKEVSKISQRIEEIARNTRRNAGERARLADRRWDSQAVAKFRRRGLAVGMLRPISRFGE